MTSQFFPAAAILISYVGHTSLQSYLAAPKVTEGDIYGARCATCPSCPDCSCTSVVILVAVFCIATGLVLGGGFAIVYLWWRSRQGVDPSQLVTSSLDRVDYGRRRGVGQLVDLDVGPPDLAMVRRR